MKTSIATVSISGALPEKLDAIASAGFDGVEIFEQDFIAHDGGAREVGRMIRDKGLDITLFQPFRDFECLPEPLRAKAFDRAKRKFDVMQELGTDLILICSSVHPRSLGGIQRAADDLAELGEIAGARGLRVGFEALAWGRHFNDHRDAWEIVRRANHDHVGLILDSFHTLGRKIDPESIRAIPGDKIFFVQLADAPAIDMDLLYWSRHFRNMPGEGDLEVRRYDAETDPAAGTTIATLSDPMARFLTAGDVEGDGAKEMVVAAKDSGLWLLRPGADPKAKWEVSLIDGKSKGFEHAALLTDLDRDGKDELYVASDDHKQINRYVWSGDGFDRETIYRRDSPLPIFTWNFAPVPVEVVR